MKRKLLLAFLISTMCMTFLSSCGGSKTDSKPQTDNSQTDTKATDNKDEKTSGKKQEIVFNATNDANVYDPRNANGIDQRTVLKQLFLGLFIKNQDGTVENALAESYTVSDDKTVYTIKLKDNMLWSDGSTVTIDDFYYAWTSAMAPETLSKSIADYFIIDGCKEYVAGEIPVEEVGLKVIDDKTLEVRLDFPMVDFVENYLTDTGFFPVKKEIVEKDSEGWFLNADTYISNGPFMMELWSPKEEIVMKKNPNYLFADKVKLDTLRYVFASEQTTAHASFTNGEISINKDIPATEIEGLLNSGLAKVFPRLSTYYYSFNMSPDTASDAVKESVWKKEVRYAMSMAIDRDAIVKTVTKGGEIPATSFSPVGIIMPDGKDYATSRPTPDALKYDVEKAKELMAQAGFPNGEGFPKLTMFYNTSPLHQAIAEVMQDMWLKNLGIQVELVNKETNVFSDERKVGKFEIVRGGNSCILDSEPDVLQIFTSGDLSRNDPKWVNPEYDALIDKAMKSLDKEERLKYYNQAEDLLLEELPAFPIYFYSNVIAMQKDVQGFYISPRGIPEFQYAYIAD